MAISVLSVSAHADDNVETLKDRIGQPLGQVKFDMQSRMRSLQRGDDGQDIALAEGRETRDPQRARDGAVEGGNLGMGIGEVIEMSHGPLEQPLAGIGEGQRPRRTDEKGDAEILLQRIDLPDNRRGGHRTPAGSARKAPRPDNVDEGREEFGEMGFHLCDPGKAVSGRLRLIADAGQSHIRGAHTAATPPRPPPRYAFPTLAQTIIEKALP